MNIKRDETLLDQLSRIVQALYADGKRPLRIYLTWVQLQALRVELRAKLRYDDVTIGKMELFGIPLEITPDGSGLWVSAQ